MKNAYTFIFGKKNVSIRDVSGHLPSWCKYQLSIAQTAILYKFKKGRMLLQQLNQKPFLIDLVEHQTAVPFSFNFKVTADQTVLYFMLQGGLSFRLPNGDPLNKVRANSFYVTHNKPCTLNVSGDSGNHIGLVVSIDSHWIKHVAAEFDTLKKFMEDFENLSQFYRLMPHCRMDKKIHHWIREIYTFNKPNSTALDGLLRLNIALTLEHYHRQLKNREGMLAYQVKQYLDAHFHDPELSYAQLTALFFSTERTLRNQFKAEFHTTIHQYYTELRLEKAKNLIETLNNPVKDVYFEVGYKDESSFRYAYRKFIGKDKE